MTKNAARRRSRTVIVTGLGIALLIAVFLSPFASKNPDGLDRVSQDLKFDTQEALEKPAEKLPFYKLFDGYALRGVPKQVATPIVGFVGTLTTFGLAWGMGKLVAKGSSDRGDSQID